MKDEETIRRERRKWIVEKILKKIRGIGLPDELSGFVFRSIHLHLPIYLLLLLKILPLRYASIIIIISLTIIIGYVYYGGCILTSVEKELCKSEESVEGIGYITIVDPLIVLCNDEITNESRKTYTIIGQSVWVITMILIYIKRIIREKGIVELKI